MPIAAAMWKIVPMLILLTGCTTVQPARLNNDLDPLQVVSHLTMAVHYHMQHGRVPQETWDTGKALKGQRGLCSQQAIALHGLFDLFGIQSRVRGLDGHVVCAVLVDGKWIVYDPDFGVVVPIDLDEIEADPSLVEPFYGRPLLYFDAKGNHWYTEKR